GGLYRERSDSRHRRPSEKRGFPDRGCFWRSASNLATDAGTGDVSLSLGLHREDRRNGSRGQGTFRDILNMLRLAILAAPAQDLCRNAGTAPARAQYAMLAGKYRLTKGAVRRGPTHGYPAD